MTTTALREPRGLAGSSRRTTREVGGEHLRELFAADPGRGERLTGEAVGLFLDYSKHRVTDETLRLLLAAGRGVAACASGSTRCSRGEKINVTEDRAVLHVALRAPARRSRSWSTARTSCPSVHAVLDRMAAFADARARGRVDAATPASAIRNVVNIGIGGSDLGPVMAYEALRALQPARPDLPLRLQRRRHRLRRGDARPRPRRDAVHRLLQDVHDAGDDDQRPHRARVAAATRCGDEAAVARHFVAVSTNAERGAPSSASTPPTCSASGTGSAAATRWTRRSACRR